MTATVRAADRTLPRPASPFLGLRPYEEADAAFFFGRSAWRDIIVANVLSTRLTVLYGPSGVGKSSLLRAAVGPHLRELARKNLDSGGKPELAVVVFPEPGGTWQGNPVPNLARTMRAAVAELVGDEGLPPIDESATLADQLRTYTEAVEGRIVVILDQFEEYFRYHRHDDGPGTLAAELPRALRQTDLRANFLLSIREDAYAKLARLQQRLRKIYDNTLRIEHLDLDAAREAIRGPVRAFGKQGAAGPEYDVEDELVETLVHELDELSERNREEPTERESIVITDQRIEAPHLQLVMQRLWLAEQARWKTESEPGPRLFRRRTLDQLHGARRIIETHLEETLRALPARDRNIAVRAFRHLVLPSGDKVAQSAADIAELTGLPEARVSDVLDSLTRLSILRTVEPAPGKPEATRYEIFHDALGATVLAHVREQRKREAERRAHRWAIVAVASLLLAAGVGALALYTVSLKENARSRELAATANAWLASDPQESLRLAVRAVTTAPTQQADEVLHAALAEADVGAVLRGHTDSVRLAVFSPNGTLVVTASDDGTARIWDARSGTSVHELRGRGGRVYAASFSPDGTLVATAGADGTARIWDARSGKSLHVLGGHSGPVYSAAFSRNGTLVATAGADRTARIWDARTGKSLHVLSGHADSVRRAGFSPNGTLVVTASDDRTARIWDARSGKSLHELRGHGGRVLSAAFSPDGTLVATAGADRTARIWDARSGKSVHVLRDHGDAVHSAVFSRNGTLVVTASDDETARIWDARSGKSVHVLRDHSGAVYSAAFSRNGTLVVTASNDGTARIWDARTGTSLAVLSGHGAPVLSAAFSRNGKLVVTASDDETARIWDARSAMSLHVLSGHTGAVYSAAFGPNGALVVTASDDETARFWDARSGKRLHELRGHGGRVLSAAFSPDGTLVVTASDDETARIWDARSGKSLVVLRGHGGAVYGANFSPNGALVVTAHDDGTARIWDALSGKSLGVLQQGDTPVYSAAFSPNGKLVATAGADGTARIWESRSGTWESSSSTSLHVLSGHSRAIYSTAFSRNGKLVVTASDDETARIWDARSGKSLVVLRGHGARVTGANFSPDGALVITASDDRTARIWYARSGRSLSVLSGHSDGVYGANFSPDGKLITTASLDRTARIYHCKVCGSRAELLDRAREQLARG